MLTQTVFEDYDLSILPTTNPGNNKPWRFAVGSAWQIVVGAFAGLDHGALTGLGDDDHPQYFNQARGDARYFPLSGGNLGGALSVTYSNTDFANVGGAGSHIKLVNPTAGQNVLSNVINGSMVSKWRNDYLGNMTFVGANYYLFTGGDYGIGKCNLRILGGSNGVAISDSDLIAYGHPANTALYVVGNEKVTGLVDAVSIRASGNNPPISGAGLELLNIGGTCYLMAYSRDAASYMPLNIDASSISLNALVFKKPFTVATLPSAAANAGAEAQVTNSTVAAAGNYGATVVGGGTHRVKVFSNGVNWIIC